MTPRQLHALMPGDLVKAHDVPARGNAALLSRGEGDTEEGMIKAVMLFAIAVSTCSMADELRVQNEPLRSERQRCLHIEKDRGYVLDERCDKWIKAQP